jgi:hypothetical protein
MRAKIAAPKETVPKSVRGGGDDDAVSLGEGLKAGGHVRGLAQGELLVPAPTTDLIYHHAPGVDAHPDREPLVGAGLEAADRIDNPEPRPDRPMGVVLVRLGVPEVDEQPVAEVLGDVAVEEAAHLGPGGPVGAYHLAHLLRVQASRQERSSRPGRRTSR